MKLIYIMGAGHVGSTIIDIVIANHPHVESLGEINKFHRFGWVPDENRICSCGMTVYKCSFWSEVMQTWLSITGYLNPTRYLELQKRFESRKTAWRHILSNRNMLSEDFQEFLRSTEALYQSVELVGGKEIMVESSLIPRRAHILARIPSISLYVIHLVRDGRGVIWSLKKPGKQTQTKAYVPKPAAKTIRYWISANLQCLWIFNRMQPDKRLLVRYEDFVTEPVKVLETIGEMVGEDLSGVVNNSKVTQPIQPRHTVAGNRIRMQKDLMIRADFEWEERLSEKDRKLFWRTAGWLAGRFGYSKY